MKGFLRCSMASKVVLSHGEYTLEPMNNNELAEENDNMRKAGFVPNSDLDCYIVEDYGAFMGNVEGNVEQANGLGEFWQEYIDKGYELVLGPPAPPLKDGYGVFCKNYLELVDSKGKSK